ncbi:MAG: hypothetical protein ACKVOK_00355 [Flavobacteriales bacterium]
MTKRQIRKEGYQLIVKSGKSHQEAFDTLKDENSSELKGLAEILSSIPSSGKQKEMATLRYVFMGLLFVIILLRLASVLPMFIAGTVNTPLIITIVVLGMFVPALGIYATLSGKTELYNSVGLLLGLSLIRSLGREALSADVVTVIVIGIIVLTIILAYYIPYKLKTPFTTTFSTENVQGINQYITHYHFEDTRLKREDVLDDGI